MGRNSFRLKQSRTPVRPCSLRKTTRRSTPGARPDFRRAPGPGKKCFKRRYAVLGLVHANAWHAIVPIPLQIQPEFRTCSEGLAECQSRIRAHVTPAVDDFIEPRVSPTEVAGPRRQIASGSAPAVRETPSGASRRGGSEVYFSEACRITGDNLRFPHPMHRCLSNERQCAIDR